MFHITSFLFEIPSGMISDVFGRRKSMILSEWMHLISAVCMAFSQSVIGFYISMIFLALGFNFSSGVREALAYDSLKTAGHEEKYVEFSSMDLILYRVGYASAILGAGLVLWIGYRKAYLIDVVIGLLGLASSYQLKEVEMEELQFDGEILSRILNCFRESFYFLTHNSRSIGLMLWNSLCGAVVILTVYFLQARLPEVGIEGVLLGPVLFVISLGGTVRAKLVLYVQKWKYWKVSVVCVTGIIIGFVCRISSLPVLMCLGGFILNVWDDLLQVHTDVILNERFPSPQRATLVSVESLCFSIVMIVLSPIMGWMFSLSYFYMNFTKNQQ